MVKRVLSRTLLASALVATLPGAAMAQDDEVTPEGTTWHLASYAVDGGGICCGRLWPRGGRPLSTNCDRGRM